MKKINKIDLKLEKEVITALSENDLGGVKGGLPNSIAPCNSGKPCLNTFPAGGCPKPITDNRDECKTFVPVCPVYPYSNVGCETYDLKCPVSPPVIGPPAQVSQNGGCTVTCSTPCGNIII